MHSAFSYLTILTSTLLGYYAEKHSNVFDWLYKSMLKRTLPRKKTFFFKLQRYGSCLDRHLVR